MHTKLPVPGSFDACAVRVRQSPLVFTLPEPPLSATRYVTACSGAAPSWLHALLPAAVLSLLHALLLQRPSLLHALLLKCRHCCSAVIPHPRPHGTISNSNPNRSHVACPCCTIYAVVQIEIDIAFAQNCARRLD